MIMIIFFRDICHFRTWLTNLTCRLFLMDIIFILIALSLLVALGFLAAFFWAVRSGQYDDEYTPSVRILFDDTKPKETSSKDTC